MSFPPSNRLPIAVCVVLCTWWSANVAGQGFTPVAPANGSTLPDADADSALFQWTATGGARHPYIEFSWDSRFRCRCRECFFQYWAPSDSTQASIPDNLWGNVVRLARLNDNKVYWRMASSSQRYRRRTNGRRRWVFGEWSYSSAWELTIPDATLTRGLSEQTPEGWKANFAASGVSNIRVWISNDDQFPLGRRANTHILAPRPGEGFVLITGRLLGRLQALAQRANLIWRVTGSEAGLGTEMVSTTGDLWDEDAVADAGPDQRNVGFGQIIALDGSNSQPSSGGAPLTYSWRQTGGTSVTLVNGTTAAPGFVTPQAFEMLSGPDQDAFGVVPVSRGDTRLTFELAVTDQRGRTDMDSVVVVISPPTNGLRNVPLNTIVHLNAPEQGGGYSWSLTTVPAGSAATLQNATTRNPFFTPDVQGTYVLTETVADPDETITVNAGKWMGVTVNCSFCHSGRMTGVSDSYTPWLGTGHATIFARGVNGGLPGYSESCIDCHVLGNDEDAANNGFDDVATQEGWTFPSPPSTGVYQAMPATLQNLGNVQCEHCHGPGSEHFGQHDAEQVSVSLNVAVCTVCHDDDHYSRKPSQWQNSGHSHEPASSSSSCAGCHTAQGFAQRMQGQTVTSPDRPEPQTCAACHDPHERRHVHQLRTIGNVKLANGKVATGRLSGICMECHHARRDTRDAATLFSEKRAPHHSGQTDVVVGTTAFEFGMGRYTNSAHAVMFTDACVHCHMAATPSSAKAGRDRVGEHTFNMSHGNVENVSPCNASGCHSSNPLTTFNRLARGDYDGGGRTEGIQDEVAGLIQVLRNGINESLGGGTFAASRGRIEFKNSGGGTVSVTETQYQAAFNCLFIEGEGTRGIHNPSFAIQVLQRSYLALTSRNVPNAVIR